MPWTQLIEFRAVDSPSEAARLAFLFNLYQAKAAPLDSGGGAGKRPRAAGPRRRTARGLQEPQMPLAYPS